MAPSELAQVDDLSCLVAVTSDLIRFNVPYRSANEQQYLAEVLDTGHLQGDGPMSAVATELLKQVIGVDRALLTTSCTHALELAALLLDLEPGDEVVVPSFTFVSTASAVVMAGGIPVFADIDSSTLNLEPSSLEQCITPRTRAVFVVHYAGVGADMARIGQIAGRHQLRVVEDNAHGLGARWEGKSLGTFGELATQSFHATKNLQCGEGGALIVNDAGLMERAEILREKGTDRSRFLRGEVDKYTWNDLGSSYLPSELQAAVLRSQLQAFEEIQRLRHRVWDFYATSLEPWADKVGARLMAVPDGAEHPAHIFYMLMPSHEDQSGLLAHLKERGVGATFHYVPLDDSPAGRRFGRTAHRCSVTHDVALRMVRLPVWAGLSDDAAAQVVEAVTAFG